MNVNEMGAFRQISKSGAEVPKPDTKAKVTLNVRPGPASPAQKAAWGKFWAKVINEAIQSENSESGRQPSSEPAERNSNEQLSGAE